MDCLTIGQNVWIIKRNYAENSFGLTNLVEAEPFKIVELKIVSVHARAGFDTEDDYVIYKLAEKIGYKPEINDMRPFEGLTNEFKEDEVFTSFSSAVLGVIEMINEKYRELQEIRQHYLNMLQEHNFKDYSKSDWIDEDLFQMQE